jgi:hypothetical protein
MPEQRESIKITYTGDLISEKTKVRCILYYSDFYRIREIIIPTYMNNSKMVGSFFLPDSVVFFQIKVSMCIKINNL